MTEQPNERVRGGYAPPWLGEPANTEAEHYPMLTDLALCRNGECSQMCRRTNPCDCCVVATGGTPEPRVDWEGVPGATEHRTLGGRAWCFQCAAYCYPRTEGHCTCCLEAARFTAAWLPAEDHPEHEALIAWLAEHASVDPDAARAVVAGLRHYATAGIP